MLPQELQNKSLDDARKQAKENISNSCGNRIHDLHEKIFTSDDDAQIADFRSLINAWKVKEKRLHDLLESLSTVEEFAEVLRKFTRDPYGE